jgi:hypothetical protein
MQNRHPTVPITAPTWHPTIEALYIRHMHNGARPHAAKRHKNLPDEVQLEFRLPQGPPPPMRPLIDLRQHGILYPEPHPVTGTLLGYSHKAKHRGQNRNTGTGWRYVPQMVAFDRAAPRLELPRPQIPPPPGTFLPAIALPANHPQMINPQNNLWIANGPAGTGLALSLHHGQQLTNPITYVPASKQRNPKADSDDDQDEDDDDASTPNPAAASPQSPGTVPPTTPNATGPPNNRKRKEHPEPDPTPARRSSRRITAKNYNVDSIADAAFGPNTPGSPAPTEYSSDSDDYDENKESYERWRKKTRAEREQRRKRRKTTAGQDDEDASSGLSDFEIDDPMQTTGLPGSTQIQIPANQGLSYDPPPVSGAQPAAQQAAFPDIESMLESELGDFFSQS